MRIAALCLILVLTLSGCGERKVYTYTGDYYNHLFANFKIISDDSRVLGGEPMLAQLDETTNKAIQALEPRTFEYYFANRYVPHTHALATKAEMMIWLKRPDLARKYYFQAIDTLKDGVNRRPEVMREKATEAQNTAIALSFVSGMAGGISKPATQLVSQGLKGLANEALSISRQLLAEAANVKNLRHADAEGDVFRNAGSTNRVIQLYRTAPQSRRQMYSFSGAMANRRYECSLCCSG